MDTGRIVECLTVVGGRLIHHAPGALLARIVTPPRNRDGDVMGGDVAVSLAVMNATMRDFSDEPESVGRELMESEARVGEGPKFRCGPVVETSVRGVRAKVYRPSTTAPGEVLPVVVYLHGGGWVLGSPETHDNTCRFLAERVVAQVVNVDYPLAPEHPFPRGLDAVLEVVAAVQAGEVGGADQHRWAVAGDSAGGNLAAAACLALPGRSLRQPRLQVLLVPVTDLTSMGTGSYSEFADGFYLTRKQMEWYIERYVPVAGDRGNPLASPLLAPDDLARDVAPACVVTAGFDPLRDEGEAYAHKLRELGVPVTLRRNAASIHPFPNAIYTWESAQDVMIEVVGALRLALAE